MGFAFRQVGGIAVDAEMHVTGMETYCRIGVSGTVIEEVCDGLGGSLSAICLRGSYGIPRAKSMVESMARASIADEFFFT
jgi:hypothetical protein